MNRRLALMVSVLMCACPAPREAEPETPSVAIEASEAQMEPVVESAVVDPPPEPPTVADCGGAAMKSAAPVGGNLFGQPTPKLKVSGDQIMLPGPVLFRMGRDQLMPESRWVLEVVRQHLVVNPGITKLRIEAHTDSHGAAATNMALSRGRAMSVARCLVSLGIACRRLVPVGFGEGAPVTSPGHAAANRRTAFVIAALSGHAVNGLPLDGGGEMAGDPCR